ncbi:metallophosphoesterase family protein, partial [Phytoactinopolyspora endophytica]|uniref:metallophosphoesterase family protein n=1 Tax=Phytoactinopolyspora endophytica TaxID=1642495 RepID=UPI001F0D7DDE
VARGEFCDIAVSQWAGQQLRADQVELLDRLEHPVRIEVDGFGAVVFCHGTPRDDDEVVLVDSSMSRWEEVFSSLDDDVSTVVCGHTHMPFQRLVDRRLVVNPGSVGMPYGAPGPHWALLRDGVVQLRRTQVDLDQLAAQVIASSGFPDVTAWADDYVRTVASDAEAVAAFGPRDGRSQ